MSRGSDPDVRWLDPDEQETWRALVGVLVKLPAALDRQLRQDADLSHIEYQVLAMLSEAPESTLAMSRLAGLVEASLPRLSQVVHRLERRGLLRRHPAPQDGRVRLVTLTPSGWDMVRSAAPGHVEAVRSFVFDPLDVTQTRQLGDLARRILEELEDES